MVIGITGVTGLLGRNLFFEFIKQYRNNLSEIEFVLFGRANKETSFKDRIIGILENDGSDYIEIDENVKSEFIDSIISRTKLIEFELTDDSIDETIFEGITVIDHLYHIAALMDFRDNQQIEDLLYRHNVEGTEKLIRSLRNTKIGSFYYIGSVYSTGHISGFATEDNFNLDANFRNPYEKTKLLGEHLVKDYSKKYGFDYKILRTSTIAGRLLENKIGSVCKYDVFYAWGAFYLRHKYRILKSWDNIYTEVVDIDSRFYMNSNGFQNIIPADYGAKIIYYLSNSELKDKSYNIVNDSNYNNEVMTRKVLELINCVNFSFVNEFPNNINSIESLYYKTVGKIYTPYTLDNEIIYDTSNWALLIQKYNLKCPEMNDSNFEKLFRFAMDNYFGLCER